MMKIIEIPQGSDQWHEERHGCITGTRFKSALGATWDARKEEWRLGKETSMTKKIQHALLCELVDERQSILEIDDYCSASMQRGNELEPLSVAAASDRLGVKFEAVGMLQHDVYDCVKFSPDAVQIIDGIVVGGYETKSKSGGTHTDYRIANEVPREHFWQCLAPMIMCDKVKYWAFGHYDDRNQVEPLFLTVIKREDYAELIEYSREVLKEFMQEVDETVIKMGGEYNG